MMKKTLSIILAVALALMISSAAFAANPSTDDQPKGITLGEAVTGVGVDGTSQFLVTITRPDGDETTFKKSYVICGVTDNEGIRVALAVYDESEGSYVYMKNTDGESIWDAGMLFTKEVSLKEGKNKIKIVAYKPNAEGRYQLGTDMQVNYFTITVLKESIKDKIINNIIKITDIFKDLLPKQN